MDTLPPDGFCLDDTLLAERGRLVRLCASLTGNAAAAEDLAQETLVEAWRHQQRLHDHTACAKWLSAIARNICLRWIRAQQRHQERWVSRRDSADTAYGHESIADDIDVEKELERHELADLLDRALALLPVETRQVLIYHYIAEFSQAEMAARLGVREGTIAVRLHRGKIALRRVLTQNLHEEAISYGFLPAEAARWQETRIWCPLCGRRHLLGRSLAATGDFALCCPDCSSAPHTEIFSGDLPAAFHDVKGYKAKLTRMQTFMDRYYAAALPTGVVPCCSCGRPAHLVRGLPADAPAAFQGVPGVHIRCLTCEGSGVKSWIRLQLLTLSCSAGRRFWREHPRMRALPEQEISFAGRPAILTSFESPRSQARFDVVYGRDSHAVLDVRASTDGLGL